MGAVFTGAATAGISKMWYEEEDYLKLGALGGGAHLAASYGLGAVGMSGKGVTVLASSALYALMAPHVAETGQSFGSLMLAGVGANIAGGVVQRVASRSGLVATGTSGSMMVSAYTDSGSAP